MWIALAIIAGIIIGSIATMYGIAFYFAKNLNW